MLGLLCVVWRWCTCKKQYHYPYLGLPCHFSGLFADCCSVMCCWTRSEALNVIDKTWAFDVKLSLFACWCTVSNPCDKFSARKDRRISIVPNWWMDGLIAGGDASSPHSEVRSRTSPIVGVTYCLSFHKRYTNFQIVDKCATRSPGYRSCSGSAPLTQNPLSVVRFPCRYSAPVKWQLRNSTRKLSQVG